MVKHFFPLLASGAIFSSQILLLHGADDAGPSAFPIQEKVRFIGAPTCQSSMCHGGASPSRDQFTIWSHQDAHSRAYATLVTARSARMAESLSIASASESTRCTICHAPLADVPSGHLASTGSVTEGVSCENCHNGAAAWLRSHTRPDWTYADRLHAGLRDLRSAYVRAETCVACHQVIDPALLKAGHPELIFELDGMTASEPRHWSEKADWAGPKAWLVGQAVALREISKELEREGAPKLNDEALALRWFLYQLPDVAPTESVRDTPSATAWWSNGAAQKISEHDWTSAMSSHYLACLLLISDSFTDNTVPLPERALRAERLVLGLDRLFKSLHPEPTSPGQIELTALFAAVQDRDQFDPQAFAKALQKFAGVIKR
jgi:Cytochrome c554 and c-prime